MPEQRRKFSEPFPVAAALQVKEDTPMAVR